jgi:hypothetical protein
VQRLQAPELGSRFSSFSHPDLIEESLCHLRAGFKSSFLKGEQMAHSGWKVPGIIATGIICFVVGVGLGGLGGASLADALKWQTRKNDDSGSTSNTPGQMAMGQPGRPPGMGMGGMGAMGGMGGMGGRGPNSKNQLATLVTKLDQLTQKPLSVNLTQEQRAKLREQLQGLEKEEALSEDDAKKRLDVILEILKGDRATLEAAGYRWPGAGGGRPPANVSNPFMTEENGKHLKSLQDQVGKVKGA